MLSILADDFWAKKCEEFPIEAIKAGVQSDFSALLREAPEDHQRRAIWASEMLAELESIDKVEWSANDNMTALMLEWELLMLVESVESNAHLLPSIFPLGPDIVLSSLLSGTGIVTVMDAERYLARLALVPDALSSVQATLECAFESGHRYPKLTVEGAIGNARDQANAVADDSVFLQPLVKASHRSEPLREMLKQGREQFESAVAPAYQAYAAFLEARILPSARNSIGLCDDRDGERIYRHLIKIHTTGEHDPVDIHALGLSEVARLEVLILEVSHAAGFGNDLAGWRKHLRADLNQYAADGQQLRAEVEALSKRIDLRIPELFGRIPRATYGVELIPEVLSERLPAAYARPGPADGSAAGVHFVTGLPQKSPRFLHPALALHEAWPGHLMHIALFQEMDNLPEFRRHAAEGLTACIEGWALYCERLGEEIGLYDTHEKLYGRFEMEMWRAVRLVVDTGIHAMGWSRQQAIDYCTTYLAMPIETIEQEVDRYISLPGQALAYQIGNLAVTAARTKAEDRLGAKFNLRQFHDALIALGPVTLPALSEAMNDWVEEQTQKAPLPR